jgi:hypothetical protein
MWTAYLLNVEIGFLFFIFYFSIKGKLERLIVAILFERDHSGIYLLGATQEKLRR